VDQLLEQAEREGFSGAILLRLGDDVLLRQAYGPGSCDRSAPLAPDHRFDIASITKALTGAAVLRAQQEGLLALLHSFAAALAGLRHQPAPCIKAEAEPAG
jgi:CubicO group peptidase (beta-lactamase class C family)